MTQANIFGEWELSMSNIKKDVHVLLEENPELAKANKIGIIILKLAKKWEMDILYTEDLVKLSRGDLSRLLRVAPLVERYIRDYNA